MALQIPYSKVLVLRNGKEDFNAHCTSYSVGAGSEALAAADIIFEPAIRHTERPEVVAMSLAGSIPQDEINLVIKTAGAADRVLYCGLIRAANYQMDEHGSYIVYRARVEAHDFGLPLTEIPFWNPKVGVVALNLPCVFNPDVDGVIKPNRSQKLHPENKQGIFVHHDSTFTDAAKEYAGSPKPFLWNLKFAVGFLCSTLNPPGKSQKIANPETENIVEVLPDEPLLRNHEQPFGEYLPAQLDALLTPYGFGWTVDTPPRGKPRIRIFERGKGSPVNIDLQKEGERVDPKKTNCEALSVNADLTSGSFNRLSIYGDYIRHEGSFILKKGWPKEYDDRTEPPDENGVHELIKDAPAWKNDSTLSLVWRHWVLNEGGDYIGVREEHKQAFDFDALFGKGAWVARRRRFEPCLSLQEDGSPRGQVGGIYVEWRDLGSEDKDWKPIETLSPEGRSISILDRECGIRFDGLMPPLELRGATDPQVRVTASVQGDQRIADGRFTRNPIYDSTKYQVLDVGSKFKFRQRAPLGNPYASKFASEAWPVTFSPATSEKDDRKDIGKLASHLLANQSVASVAGTVKLLGLNHPTAVVGAVARGIPGRNVSFAIDEARTRFPSVVGLRFNCEDQSIELVLDTYRGRSTL